MVGAAVGARLEIGGHRLAALFDHAAKIFGELLDIDEAALARALDAGHLAGAALDVMPQEPPSNSPLLGRDNVILTPHTSFYSEESLVELQTKAAEEVVCVLSGQTPRNPVNPEVLQRTAQTLRSSAASGVAEA